MYFWLKGFCFMLVMIRADSKLQDLNFNVMAVGHSGLLISWDTDKVKDTNYTNFIVEYIAISEKGKNNTLYRVLAEVGQYQISGLNESTHYQINVSSIDSDKTDTERYSTQGKTEQKIDSSPQKPDLKLILRGTRVHSDLVGPFIRILWLPCGKDRVCNIKQPSTHFTVRYKVSQSKQWFESGGIYNGSYLIMNVFPGRLYQVIVTSINGDFKTDSDTEDIFIKPESGPVQSAKVIQMSNTSLQIKWKSPRHNLHNYKLVMYLISFIESKSTKKVAHFCNQPGDVLQTLSLWGQDSNHYEQAKIWNLKIATEYHFFIIPEYWYSPKEGLNEYIYGLEYEIHYILHPRKSELLPHPLAKPDIQCIEQTYTRSNCTAILIQWLPCGKNDQCENTRPGSSFTLQIRNEKTKKTTFNGTITTRDHEIVDIENTGNYEVTVRSLDGTEISEAVSEKVIVSSCKELSPKIPPREGSSTHSSHHRRIFQ